jgi:succinate dehydrogenase / fumarate reductase cytochrome b subunit
MDKDLHTAAQISSTHNQRIFCTMPLKNLIRSAVGRKLFMAATGLVLFGFVVAHLLGNLSIYLGADGINAYAKHLHQLEPLLWIFRLGLAGAFILHVLFGVTLTLENRRARPVAYKRKKHPRSSLAGRTMIYSGLLLAAFIGFHLAHFTFRSIGPPVQLLDGELLNVFQMIVDSFQQVGFALAYIVAMTVLFFHLSHGFASLFQSTGMNNDVAVPWLDRLSRTAAIVLAAGFVSIPVLIFFDLVIK